MLTNKGILFQETSVGFYLEIETGSVDLKIKNSITFMSVTLIDIETVRVGNLSVIDDSIRI